MRKGSAGTGRRQAMPVDISLEWGSVFPSWSCSFFLLTRCWDAVLGLILLPYIDLQTPPRGFRHHVSLSASSDAHFGSSWSFPQGGILSIQCTNWWIKEGLCSMTVYGSQARELVMTPRDPFHCPSI